MELRILRSFRWEGHHNPIMGPPIIGPGSRDPVSYQLEHTDRLQYRLYEDEDWRDVQVVEEAKPPHPRHEEREHFARLPGEIEAILTEAKRQLARKERKDDL